MDLPVKQICPSAAFSSINMRSQVKHQSALLKKGRLVNGFLPRFLDGCAVVGQTSFYHNCPVGTRDLNRCMIRFSGHEGVEGLHTCSFYLLLQEGKLEKCLKYRQLE